jgi:hypothetical protein
MAKGFGRFLRRNTIALLALFLVLGGSSYAAATAINGKTIKPNSIPKNRLTKTAIKQLRGNRGPQGLRGPTGPQGVQGVQGIQGIAGTARAYGLVNGPGTAVTRSKNVVSITHPNTGQYCITLDPSVPASTTGAVAMPDYASDSTLGTNIAHVEFYSPSLCAGNTISFLTWEVTANGTSLVNTAQDQPFFFVIP